MESPLLVRVEKKIISISLCFHAPALLGPENTQAQHCECAKQLELLIPSSQLVSFAKDYIAVLINNLGAESSLVLAQTIVSIILTSLLQPRSRPTSYNLFFFFPQ